MNEVSTPYSVSEVAALTGFSSRTVTKIFEEEPGHHYLRDPQSEAQAEGVTGPCAFPGTSMPESCGVYTR